MGAAMAGAATIPTHASAATDKRDRRIESFDGVELAATLYEPAGDGPNPAVLMTHGYGSFRGDPEITREAERYAEAGYVVLAYDSRGFNDSGGVSGFNGPKEVADAITLVDRLTELTAVATDDAGVPRVGMDGLSYAGGIQQNAAAARPALLEELGVDVSFDLEDGSPLDAIVPRMTWNDLRRAIAPNGVLKRNWTVALVLAGMPGGHGLTTGNPTLQGTDPRHVPLVAQGLLENEMTPAGEEYLEVRSPMAMRPGDVDVPALFIQGWPDTVLPPNEAVRSFRALRRADTPARLLMYPGGHDDEEFLRGLDASVRAKLNRASLAWLDYHVHPDPPRSLSLPDPVTLHTDRPEHNGGHDWRTAETFPPAAATPRPLSLSTAAFTDATPLVNSVAPTASRGPTGTLIGSPGGDAPVTSVSFDFEADGLVELVGRPTIDLTVEPFGGPAHLFVKLEYVSDGRGTVIDEQVTPFRTPGDGPTSVGGRLAAVQQYLDAGERLRVTISTTENGYASARESGGVLLSHAGDESTLTVPAVTEEATLEGTPAPL